MMPVLGQATVGERQRIPTRFGQMASHLSDLSLDCISHITFP